MRYTAEPIRLLIPCCAPPSLASAVPSIANEPPAAPSASQDSLAPPTTTVIASLPVGPTLSTSFASSHYTHTLASSISVQCAPTQKRKAPDSCLPSDRENKISRTMEAPECFTTFEEKLDTKLDKRTAHFDGKIDTLAGTGLQSSAVVRSYRRGAKGRC